MRDIKSIFCEFDRHLLEDHTPSVYFEELLKDGLLKEVHPFTMLGALVDTPQSLEHHPEGNVWNHTMLVVDRAAEHKSKSEVPRVFMWAALLHDLGKPDTTRERKGRITAYDHDKLGEKLARKFLGELTDEQEFIDAVAKLVRWHMQTLFVVKNLHFAEVHTMLQQVKLEEIALLSLCDRLGRGKLTKAKENEERLNIDTFIKRSLEKNMHLYK